MIWLDQKYIGFIAPRLDRFRKIGSNRWNFRCPLCGDSAKNPNKARGNIYEKSGSLLYHCFNCGETKSIPQLVKFLAPDLYNEYVKEKLISTGSYVKTDVEVFADKMKKPKFVKYSALDKLDKISSLPHDHFAKRYVLERQIPTHYHYKLFFTPKFKEFVNTLIPKKFDPIYKDEPRLIIPLIGKHENLIGFQGRALGPVDQQYRYITIILHEDHPNIFNLDTLDDTKPYFIFEGPIDAMFIENSIAMAGGSICDDYVNENGIFVYDNEPRSIETCNKIQKSIDKGYKISLFPSNIDQKDINEMVLSGYNSSMLASILTQNTSQGLQAQMNFNTWKRVK